MHSCLRHGFLNVSLHSSAWLLCSRLWSWWRCWILCGYIKNWIVRTRWLRCWNNGMCRPTMMQHNPLSCHSLTLIVFFAWDWWHCHSLSLASLKSRLVLVLAHPGNPRQSPDGRKKVYIKCIYTVGHKKRAPFILVVKKLRKSINICQSYRKNKRGTFFYGPRCINCN